VADLNFIELRQKCESWLREGKGSSVVHALSSLNVRQIPRSDRRPLAILARRANLVSLGLRILSPVVHAERNSYRPDVREEEWAEYGILLCQIGSRQEGLKILNKIRAVEFPDALLYRAFCHFNQWEYREALPLLEEYCRHPKLTPYQRAIGAINLVLANASCGNDDFAFHELEKLQAQFKMDNYSRLLANSIELKAQIEIKRGRYSEAHACLEQASQILSEDITSDQLFVEKWKSVLRSIKTKDPQHLHRFRKTAQEKGGWESVRECDFYLYKLQFDEPIFQFLYFGTPFESYRKRLLEIAHSDPGTEYLLGTGASLFELRSGEFNGQTGLNLGKKIHQFLALMLSDFYKPFQLGSVFSRVFPGENFNIFSSASRVHQLVFRTRKILKESQLPLSIIERDGCYHFHLAPGCRIRIHRDIEVGGSELVTLAMLRELFQEQIFSARQVRESLGLPVSSLARILRYGLSKGMLSQQGSGPKTRYRFQRDTSIKISRAG